MVDIIGLLSTDGYIMCNKQIIKMFGADCAVLLGELCAEYKYFEMRGELDNGAFYATQDTIEENTGLSKHCQRTAITTLKDAEILYVEKRGLPAKNYFIINTDKLSEIFTTSGSKIERLDIQKLNLNNNRINNNSILSKDNISDTSEQSKSFLGSIKKQNAIVKPKKKTLYDKCLDYIYEYTDNAELQKVLVEYLSVRLANKDKPLLGINQWKGMLKKLNTISKPIDAVNESIERGWCSFFDTSHTNTQSIPNKSKFGEIDAIQTRKEFNEGDIDSGKKF